MAWLPGVDEKPFSISAHGLGVTQDKEGDVMETGFVEITVKRLGPISGRIAELKEGDMLGVRGPYGHPFSWGKHNEICFVAGGVGLAALAPLAFRNPGAPVLYGENTAAQVMFLDRFPGMRIFTVDGSGGDRGFPTDALPALLAEGKIKKVYSCGPEVMMSKVVKICHEAGVASEVSLERYMKCAVGVCGQCCMDGLRVCADGPVFDGELLRNAKDFGFRKLDKSGTWVMRG